LVDFALSPGVRTGEGSQLLRSVLLHNARVGRGAIVRDAILDKNVVVLDGATVGVDKDRDRARGFTVSDGGVTAVGKGQVVQ
jgi:glucose-1-phosphate adenylyltransferase